MADFSIALDFIDATVTPPPAGVDLLFFNATKGWLTRGWVDESRQQLVLIGSQFTPTHYAHFTAALEPHGPERDYFGHPIS